MIHNLILKNSTLKIQIQRNKKLSKKKKKLSFTIMKIIIKINK